MYRHKHSIMVVLVVLACSFSLASADVVTGLVSHWMLDDGAGPVATDSVGGNDGKLQGDATWAAGFVGGALLLDGDGDFVDCGNKEAYNITDAVTLAAWVQARGDFAYPDWSGIIMRGGPNIDTFALYYYGPGKQIGFKTTGTNPPWFATNANDALALFDGDWHHVAATYDGETKTIYLDGAVLGSAASSGKIETSNGRVLLGAGRDTNPPTLYLAGRIDDARIYQRGLSAKDVKEFVPPKVQARKPDPADGANAVAAPLFRWVAGETAVLQNVYLGKSADLGPADLVASRQPAAITMYWHLPGLEPGTTYYWRVDSIEADGTTIHTGTVWSFITQALTAYHPEPADGANGVSVAPTLTWLPGQAAVQHHLYLGTSLDAVSQGTGDVDKGALAEATFVPGTLESTTTYHWRVDELVAGGAIKAGAVWSFTTCLPVDDFESYTDEEGSRIYETWLDGWADNSSGSRVGYTDPPFAEQTIVHGGLQSMPLDYNNVSSPFYSEAQRTFDSPQDWTVDDVNALVLYVRGKANNRPAQLSLTIKDASNHEGVVIHSDPAAVTATKWIEWKIPLGVFSDLGINLARVKQIRVGVGNQDDPAQGGTGLIFLDDICMVRSAPGA